MNTRNIYLYWPENDYKLICILRNLIYLHSTSGIGYNVILLNDKNINNYIKYIPVYFDKLSPVHKADFVKVNVICDHGGIWLDSDTIVLESLDSLFYFIEKNNGFFIKENNQTLCNGIFGSKPNTQLMINWRTEMINILNNTQSGTDSNLLEYIYNTNSDLYNDYNIFNGLDNLYPINFDNCVSEFIDKPYDNYKKIIREYQPLIMLKNSIYKKIEHKNEKDILEENMPLNYFINKSFENASIIKDPELIIDSCDWCKTDGNNFGDMITPYIYKNILKTNIIPQKNGNTLLGAGSILNFLTDKNSIVWGSGLGMKELIDKVIEPKTILSVRGNLTYIELIKKGIKCPKIFGDPGLILQKFYNPKIEKKYKIGVIPHWIEYNLIKSLINNKNIIVINLQDDFEHVINSVLACDYTMSTSLHGIILSHAYKIQCAWIRLPEQKCKIKGGNFKFLDYYSSLEIFNVTPIIIDDKYFEKKDDILISTIKNYPNPEDYILNRLIYNTLYLCPIKNQPKKERYIIYTDWLKTYLTREHYLFVKKLETYGWKLIELSNLDIGKLTKEKCLILFITYDDFDISKVKCQNCTIIYKIDDLYPFKEIRKKCIESSDMIIGPYQYLFNTQDIIKMYPKINTIFSYHIPYSAVDDFYSNIGFNNRPIEKIFLSGSISGVYTLRKFITDNTSFKPYIEVLKHPTYKSYTHDIIGEKYYKELNKYICCFTDASVYKYLLLKIFEICSVGSLLLVEDSISKQLNKLGLYDKKNCIMCNKSNIANTIKWILDKNNRLIVDKIRKSGMEIVRTKHNTSIRAHDFNKLI